MASETPSPEAIRAGALSALLEELVRVEERPAAEPWGEALRPGASIGRFELVREIGRGGFGVVWEALDRELGRAVALKAVRPGARPDIREERLLREAEAAARLSHPNIVTLHDAGRTEHGPYLVLELLRGEPLVRRLARGRLSLHEALGIALQVAEGLAHAHREGVVHRDLTPGNVFLCQGGQVKLLDLGMAHAFGRRKVEGGTPAYMAPEQWRDAPEDERTDVFALGVMLFRMLTGELPFPDDAGRSARGREPAPRLEVPASPALGALVAAMLAKDPAARVRDGAAALAGLRRIAAELPRDPPVDALPVVVRRARARAPDRRPRAASVAVLPFADMSPERDQGYFADGIAEEILNALTQVEGVRVSGRTSSFSFKNANRTIADIGRELNVATILEGSVRKAGDHIRVAAHLIKTADGFELWSQSFDRDLSDVFAVQDEIAGAVVEALRIKLLPGSRVRGRVTASREAYELFLLGRDLARTGDVAQTRRSLAALERAVFLDPGFALAWAEVAGVLLFLEGVAGDGNFPERRRRALEAAERAIRLAPDQSDGYVRRAAIRSRFLLDWQGALADAERAQALGPGNPAAVHCHGSLLTDLGRLPDACRALERATELDPFSAHAWTLLGRALVSSGHHGRARSALARALEISPHADLATHYLCADLVACGEPERALAEAERVSVRWVSLTCAALAYHDLGRAEASRAALEALAHEGHADSAYQLAEVHAWRGEADLALGWLERARAQVDTGIGWIKTDPLLEKLRGDRRYLALLQTLNLPLD